MEKTKSKAPPRPQKALDNVTPFKGKDDVLSNFYPCKVHVYGRTFASSEHAYQYKKAVASNQQEMAEEFLKLESARNVKILSGQIKTDDKWKENKLNIMRKIIRAKAESVAKYRSALQNARQIIAEAVPDDNYWSCGLSKDEVIYTPVYEWPGQNIMGRLHMELRDELFGDVTHKQVNIIYTIYTLIRYLSSNILKCTWC